MADAGLQLQQTCDHHTSVILDTVDVYSVFRVRDACHKTNAILQDHLAYVRPEELARGVPLLSNALSLLLGFAIARSGELVHAHHTEWILLSTEEIKGAMPTLLEAMKTVVLAKTVPESAHQLRAAIVQRITSYAF